MGFSTELIIITSGMALFILWFLLALFYSVSGTWQRCDKASEGSKKERLVLGQIGPFIAGRVETFGGHQVFWGYSLGPRVWLKRRDYGVAALMRQGFPKPIARDVEGQIMARYKLRLDADKFFLDGLFTPYKVSFTLKPPKVNAMQRLEPTKRTYRKVEFSTKKVIAKAQASLD